MKGGYLHHGTGWFRKIKNVFFLFLLMSLAGCGFLFKNYGGPSYPLGMPRYFKADYNRVWNALLDTLDEEGYVIAQMSKTDGYITTNMKERLHYRTKLNARLVRENDAVKVTINSFTQRLEGLTSERPYWVDRPASGGYQQMILDHVGERLDIKKERN